MGPEDPLSTLLLSSLPPWSAGQADPSKVTAVVVCPDFLIASLLFPPSKVGAEASLRGRHSHRPYPPLLEVQSPGLKDDLRLVWDVPGPLPQPPLRLSRLLCKLP